jgi:DNA-binding transcriptional ArsR family regulator
MVEHQKVSPDAVALQALAHPLRVRLLGLLRLDGPATASSLAARVRTNSGATSYHLRQLAEHGFVVEASELGNRRERWWRAVHRSTSVDWSGDPRNRDAEDAFWQIAAVEQANEHLRAAESLGDLDDGWRSTATTNDTVFVLDTAQARQMRRRIHDFLAALQEEFGTRDDPRSVGEQVGPGQAIYVVQAHGFPLVASLGAARDDTDDA